MERKQWPVTFQDTRQVPQCIKKPLKCKQEFVINFIPPKNFKKQFILYELFIAHTKNDPMYMIYDICSIFFIKKINLSQSQDLMAQGYQKPKAGPGICGSRSPNVKRSSLEIQWSFDVFLGLQIWIQTSFSWTPHCLIPWLRVPSDVRLKVNSSRCPWFCRQAMQMMTEMRKACAVAMLEVVLVWGFRHHLYSPYHTRVISKGWLMLGTQEWQP